MATKPSFDRTAAERRVQRDIARWFASRRAAWSRQAATGRIPQRFRDEERDALAAILFRRALDTAQWGLSDALGQAKLPGDRAAEAGDELTDRVRKLSERTAGTIITTTVSDLGGRSALKNPDLRETRINRLFGQTRAEALSINVTTDSRSTGQLAVGIILGEDVEYDQLWITEDDGRVCPVCGRLHRKGRAVWSIQFPNGPKAHPRCRCDLETVVKISRRRRT